MNHETLDATSWRAQARMRLRARHAALPDADRARKQARVNELLRFGFAFPPGCRIAGYVPRTGEVDPRIAVAWFRDRAARAPGGGDATPRVVLVPLLGFDEAGHRLGQGDGHHDRMFAGMRGTPVKIGVGYECGRVDSVHPMEHDVAMDFIVTEDGIREVTPGGLRLIERLSDAGRIAAHLMQTRQELSRGDLGRLLNSLLEAERAGAMAISAFMDEMPLPKDAHARLAEIQRDESHNCAALLELLRALDLEPSRSVGTFFDKALAIEGDRARLEFLNRGQAWVARRIGEALPRIAEPEARSLLLEMKDSHLANIAACEELMDARIAARG